ncbi:MAG: exodeoxyribonuclease VII large subunit [Candidatus Paracaedimonas acanthamoebae]|uniref:Exodeoxyribonuclease 7 large subunit n=1 Tax=Candidatus Paracaedimonas acanthamoebae TaxID=244581 RepID=A0A8J7TSH0_9PROT|nr:exodeoxyribonuclease VII large subunit [Candidatus Paracaedimonas acanthamoebae]
MSFIPEHHETFLPEPLSVSAVAYSIKNTLEQAFNFIRIKGEISGAKLHTSGHFYFALKDEQSVLDGVCWKGVYGRLPFKPVDGMEVICTGRITSYPARSKYQIVVEAMEIAGEGALLKILEERRRKLAAEGLFAEERKKSLPFIPQVIGVVTSATGAVIRDILHRLQDRFPRHVIVWPVLVQGEGAAAQIATAIESFNRLTFEGTIPRPDLLIVARGGGSLEDLWSFNEEIVVRAVARSHIPIISAVGHETDTTLIDFAADWRAPTPTAAAERAVPVRRELLDISAKLLERLNRGLLRYNEGATQYFDDWNERFLNTKTIFFTHIEQRLKTLVVQLKHPRMLLAQSEINIHNLSNRLNLSGKQYIEQRLLSFQNMAQLLQSYSFHRTLERGFCLVRSSKGEIVKKTEELRPQQIVTLTFQDGDKLAKIQSEAEKSTTVNSHSQGSLF